MGREIRRVPPGWQHPTFMEYNEPGRTVDCNAEPDDYIPLYDQNYDDAAQQWIADLALWEKGRFQRFGPDYLTADGKRPTWTDDAQMYFWEYRDVPAWDSYRRGRWAFSPAEATAYQVYENVSEGTPVSPVFVDLDALRVWIAIEQPGADVDETIEAWLAAAALGRGEVPRPFLETG